MIGGVLLRTAVHLDAGDVTGAALVIAKANRHIDALMHGDTEELLTQVVKAQVVAQGCIADVLSQVSAGETNIATVQSQYTGDNLEQAISAAQTKNVLPPVPTISDASEPVSVDFSTADYHAGLDDGDYLATSGMLMWEPGDTSDRTIQVIVTGDAKFEPNEAMLVILSNAENAAIRKDIGVGAILNDDGLSGSCTNRHGPQ